MTRNYDYDAFGNEKTPSDADSNPFRYCGEYFDRETGTYYLRARYYDPTIGRFTQQDTYKGDYNDPLSLNLYTYCRNNPVIYIDPSGHFFEGLGAGIKSGIRSVIHGADNMASNKWNLDTTAAGAAFLQMEQDSSGVYHATFDCWQAYFGYTDMYDFFFDLGTSMDTKKYNFTCGGQNYVIWAWKGDYINLGGGAELGIYKQISLFGLDTPLWAIDKSLAMPMTMRLTDIHGNVIADYRPSEKQWWITSFNPKYKNVNADDLTVVYTVRFENSALYNAFFQKFGESKNYANNKWTFNSETQTATFKF